MALKRIYPEVLTASGDGWAARKSGNLVELRLEGLESATSFPAEFAPTKMTYVPVSAQSTTNLYTPRVALNPSGYITPQGYSGKAWAVIVYTN
ncbi:hypothetical protein [Corynebacterium aurimucosum]